MCIVQVGDAEALSVNVSFCFIGFITVQILADGIYHGSLGFCSLLGVSELHESGERPLALFVQPLVSHILHDAVVHAEVLWVVLEHTHDAGLHAIACLQDFADGTFVPEYHFSENLVEHCSAFGIEIFG